MTLSEFIKKLQVIEAAGAGDVPVVVADWPEGYEFPSAKEQSTPDVNLRVINVVDPKWLSNGHPPRQVSE